MTGSRELGQETALELVFTSQNVIPSNSVIVVTMPTNIQIKDSVLKALLNSNPVSLSYSASSRQLKVTT